MWRHLKEDTGNDPREWCEITRWAVSSLPLHKKQSKDIVRSWQNRGLVRTHQAATQVRLTAEGVETDAEEL
jgi:hypothetical protein